MFLRTNLGPTSTPSLFLIVFPQNCPTRAQLVFPKGFQLWVFSFVFLMGFLMRFLIVGSRRAQLVLPIGPCLWLGVVIKLRGFLLRIRVGFSQITGRRRGASLARARRTSWASALLWKDSPEAQLVGPVGTFWVKKKDL